MTFEKEFPSLKDKHFRALDPPDVVGFERYIIKEHTLDKQRVKEAIKKYQQKVLFDTNRVDKMDIEYSELIKELGLEE